MTDTKRFGPYEIIEKVDSGSFATVYKARDLTLNRIVALKIMHAGLLSNPAAQERFVREAQAAANLEHPNIVHINKVGEEQGQPYIDMTFLPGRSLDKMIAEGPLPVERAVSIARQVAEALGYAHQRDFLHRDVKPQNIIVDDEDRAVLTDFGLVKALAWASLTGSGGMVGTPGYIAPEIWEEAEATPASDVYAVGVILWEMLAGHTLFPGKTPAGVMRKHLTEVPPPLDSVRPDVPAPLAAAVARVLAKDPAQRPQSGKELAQVLDAFMTLPEEANAVQEQVRGGGGKEIARSGARQQEEADRLHMPTTQTHGQVGVTRRPKAKGRGQPQGQQPVSAVAQTDRTMKSEPTRLTPEMVLETERRLARLFADAELAVKSDPIRALEVLAQIHREQEDYPGLQDLRQRAVAERDRHLAQRFAEAKKAVEKAPERALELLAQIEREQPDYVGLQDLRHQAQAALRERERRLARLFAEAQQAVQTSPKRALELVAKIQEEQTDYAGLLDLGQRAHTALQALSQRLAALFAEAEKAVSKEPARALAVLAEIEKEQGDYPGLSELRQQAQAAERERRLAGMFAEAKAAVEGKPAQTLQALSELEKEEPAYPGLQELRQQALSALRERDRRLARVFVEAERLVQDNPSGALELVMQIEQEQPDYPALAELRQKAEAAQKKAQAAREQRLKQLFGEAARAAKTDPPRALELLAQIEREQADYVGLQDLRQQAEAALRERERRLATLFAQAEQALHTQPTEALKALADIQKEQADYPGLAELRQQAQAAEREQRLAALFARAEKALDNQPTEALKALAEIEKEQADYPGLAELRQQAQAAEREQRLAGLFAEAEKVVENKPARALEIAAQIRKEREDYPGLRDLLHKAQAEQQRRLAERFAQAKAVARTLPGLALTLLAEIETVQRDYPGLHDLRQEAQAAERELQQAREHQYAKVTSLLDADVAAALAELRRLERAAPGDPRLTPLKLSILTKGRSLLPIIVPDNGADVGPIARLGKGTPKQVTWSADGRWLAVACESGCLCVYDAQTMTEVTLIWAPAALTSVAFSPDGRLLASGADDKTVRLWETASGKEVHVFKKHTGGVFSVAFAPDGKTLASASHDNTVRLWDAASGKELRTLSGHTSYVISVAFSPDGRTLASASSDETVRLWDVASGKELRTLSGHTSYLQSVAFAPDGQTLASGSSDRTVRLWDVATGRELRTLSGHTSYVHSVAFAPDGKTLASGSDDKTLRLWDVATGRELRTLSGHTSYVYSVAFAPDGKTLASGSDDYTLRLWDVARGKELRTLSGHTSYVHSVAFAPDGKTLASGSEDNTVRLWRAAEDWRARVVRPGILEQLFAGGDMKAVCSVCFSPDGQTLASGSHDNAVRLWRVSDGSLVGTLSGHTSYVYSVAFAPDGRTLASGSYDKTVRLWDVASGKELRTLSGHTSYLHSVVFAPDGKTLASGSYDATVRLWDVASGKELRTLSGHTATVHYVAFAPDGKTLASGSTDGTIMVWGILPGGRGS